VGAGGLAGTFSAYWPAVVCPLAGVTVLELSTVIGAVPKPLQLVLGWNGTAAWAVPLTVGGTLRSDQGR
jgi:hypothetical protein